MPAKAFPFAFKHCMPNILPASAPFFARAFAMLSNARSVAVLVGPASLIGEALPAPGAGDYRSLQVFSSGSTTFRRWCRQR